MKAKLQPNWRPVWEQRWPKNREHPKPLYFDPEFRMHQLSNNERMLEKMLARYNNGDRRELREVKMDFSKLKMTTNPTVRSNNPE